jgi:hypothetical protein
MSTSTVISSLEPIPLPAAAPQIRRSAKTKGSLPVAEVLRREINTVPVSTENNGASLPADPPVSINPGPTTDEALREFSQGITPGELYSAFHELEKTISLSVDKYVELTHDALHVLDDLLPLIDQMQSMLSQRGQLRKLMTTANVPTWTAWFEKFRDRLQIDITLRAIQMRLKKYREVPVEPLEPTVNEVGATILRSAESKVWENLPVLVADRSQLNPTICEKLIRTLRARGKKLLETADELEKGFQPLPADTGICHQKLVALRLQENSR